MKGLLSDLLAFVLIPSDKGLLWTSNQEDNVRTKIRNS